MAPEVGTEEAYNELCDVYSFGIVAWEMMAMTKPYGKIRMVGLLREVWIDDANARRPSPSLVEVGCFMKNRSIRRMFSRRRLRKNSDDLNVAELGTPASLQSLLEDCWANDIARRPSMLKVLERMELEVVAMKRNTTDDPTSHLKDGETMTTDHSSGDVEK
jgi:serine/threonine protein kinase